MDEVIAKQLFMHDCDFMWDATTLGKAKLEPGRCPYCRNWIRQVVNIDYENYKLKRDIYCTYDGYAIVSEKFRHFCLYHKYEGLRFTKLPKTNGYFFFEATLIYPIDNLHSTLLFEKYRRCCNSYDWHGCPKMYGSMRYENEHFIKRTVWQLAGDPPFIVDIQTADAMVKEGLSGMCFKDVFYFNDEPT